MSNRHKWAERRLARKRAQSHPTNEQEHRHRAELSAFCNDLGRLAWAVCMLTRTVRLNNVAKDGK
jgi:hypothetical protein